VAALVGSKLKWKLDHLSKKEHKSVTEVGIINRTT